VPEVLNQKQKMRWQNTWWVRCSRTRNL